MTSKRRGGWQTVTVGKLVDAGLLLIGDGYRAKNVELGDVGTPFVRAGDIRSGFALDGLDRLLPERVPHAGHKVSRPGDVVFTSKGTVGRFGFVTRETPELVYSPQLCFWRVRDLRQIDPRFLYFWMHGDEFRCQLNAVKGQTDMADYVSLRDQRAIVIAVPSLEEQKAIATVLAALEDKIDSNRRASMLLGEGSAALFARLDEAAMDTVPLGEVVEVIDCLHSKKPQRQSEGRLFLQLDNIRDDGLLDVNVRFLINDVDYKAWTRRIELRHGDCVITNVGRVGAVARIPNIAAALGRNMTGLRCRPDWPFPGVLVQALMSSRTRRAIYALKDAGTVMDALNVRNIPKLPIAVLSRESLARAEARLSVIWAFREALLEEANTLRRARDALLPKLISGEIRVPDTTDPEEVIGPAAKELVEAGS